MQLLRHVPFQPPAFPKNTPTLQMGTQPAPKNAALIDYVYAAKIPRATQHYNCLPYLSHILL